jgi:L,D-peptidoglycan transpeptidase YkuD (ErfK/YbiS/YcfS/YnhG family)
MCADRIGTGPVLQSPATTLKRARMFNVKMRGSVSVHLFLGCIILAFFYISGCRSLDKGLQAEAISQEAYYFFKQGNYEASLGKYKQLIQQHPEAVDRVLFEMGIIHAHPGNIHKDYQKAMECFQKIVKDYPGSDYGHDSRMMILQIKNVILKDKIIAAQQTQIDTSSKKLMEIEYENIVLKKKIESLRLKLVELRTEPVDEVLIEKRARRLTLFSKGEVIKTYRIALGGNPVGPKEKQGDNKTPEGIYTIESRNRASDFHLSLRISYPNEKDKRRARELGVYPGGDIMIHGIKNGFSSVGAFHTRIDWTKGCIAVTDKEIKEIERLVPNGTRVEIRP